MAAPAEYLALYLSDVMGCTLDGVRSCGARDPIGIWVQLQCYILAASGRGASGGMTLDDVPAFARRCGVPEEDVGKVVAAAADSGLLDPDMLGDGLLRSYAVCEQIETQARIRDARKRKADQQRARRAAEREGGQP